MSRSAFTWLRPLGLLIVVLAMGYGVWHVGEHLREKYDPADHVSVSARFQPGPLEVIKAESGMYHAAASSVPLNVTPRTDVVLRDLKTYYRRRSYAGAPPRIPHPVDVETAFTQSCNVCHAQGGFVPKFNAYAPVTPHPEYFNCMQCHVAQEAADSFSESLWVSVKAPALHRPELPGSPPPIPHTLQLRENCLPCHAGPAAPLEIRTTHPERVSCRQCHVPRDTGKEFVRTVAHIVDAQSR